MTTEFYEQFKTYDELASWINGNPEIRGLTSPSQYVKDNLPKESEFQAKIIKALKEWRADGSIDKNAVIWKQGAGVYNRNGLPDVMAVISCRLFCFEVKRPFIGKATPLQEKTMRELNKAGAVALVCSYPSEAKQAITEAGLWNGEKETEELK